MSHMTIVCDKRSRCHEVTKRETLITTCYLILAATNAKFDTGCQHFRYSSNAVRPLHKKNDLTHSNRFMHFKFAEVLILP